jgi:mono/diheme cytochrome c family protein
MRNVALIAAVAGLLPALLVATSTPAAAPKDPSAKAAKPAQADKPAGGAAGAGAAASGKSPTFAKDVAPILFDNCVSCHRPGEVAPFTLTDYEDARKRAKTIARVTEEKFMPPWKAEPGHGEFLSERRLTDKQVKTLRAWADAGAPQGDPKKTPKLPKFADGWQLGEPDLVVSMPETFTVPAEGNDVYRCFVLPLGLEEDRYVEAVEFRPGNRKIVHHALFFLDDSGKARELDAQEDGPGYSRMGGPGFTPSGTLGGWAPGYMPERLPAGVARSLKAGSDLVMQTHFHPSGKAEGERSQIGIHFAKTKPKKLLASIPQAIRKLDIPAGEKDYRVSNEFELPLAAELIGITPHAHLLCTEIKVDATLPAGKQLPLIWIKDWDFNWQGQYQYKQTVRLPRGTKVKVEFAYDNSAENPAQPSNPPQRVTWGEQTTDEMALVFYQVLVDPRLETLFLGRGGRGGSGMGKDGDKPRRGGGLMQRALDRFDKNKNGKLDPDEQREAMDALGG